MAYTFDGVNDVITATITAVDTGDWTIGAWMNPESRGQADAGRVISISSASNTLQEMQIDEDGTAIIEVMQDYNTTNANAEGDDAFNLNEWTIVFATFTESTKRCAIYTGTLTTPVTALPLSVDVAGVGTRQTGGVTARIGNDRAEDNTFDGRLAGAFFAKRLLTLADMERIRLGERIYPDTTNLAGYWTLDADAKDRSGNGADGTVSGAVLSDGPGLASAAVSATSLTATAVNPTSLTLTAL